MCNLNPLPARASRTNEPSPTPMTREEFIRHSSDDLSVAATINEEEWDVMYQAYLDEFAS